LLLELNVKSLGIIDEITWALGGGLNVITGETGAGKSLVVDAVEALLAGKVDESSIRHGDSEARIEGVFILPRDAKSSRVRMMLAEKGIESEEDTLVITCTLQKRGRNVIRINGQAVTKGFLQQVGQQLVDIHGQSEHLSLLDKKYHLDFLDAYAHAIELRRDFGESVAELIKTEQELQNMLDAERNSAQREELLRYQVDEIMRAGLREGEEEDLEKEKTLLASAEKLKELSYRVYQLLYGDESTVASASVMEKLGEALQAAKELAGYDAEIKERVDFMEETSYGLEETAHDMRSYSECMENDPQRMEEIENRRELVRNLKHKYGSSIGEILAYREKASLELEGIFHSSERKSSLEQEITRLRKDMGKMAAELSAKRKISAVNLAAEVKRELDDLDMAQVEFEVSIKKTTAESGLPFPDGGVYAFNADGADMVEFMASTNPGEPFKPLAKIASTGEVSRFMLALKGALAQADSTPILVFDEIDIGVGGRSGEVIGRKLWALAKNRQVICVTHLPQIAAFADEHYSVRKEVSEGRTASMLRSLEDKDRLREMAAMLAGPEYTDAALTNAREIVRKADDWKKGLRRLA